MKEIEILYSLKQAKDAAIKTLNDFSNPHVKKVLDVYYFDPLRKDLVPSDSGRLVKCFRLRKKGDSSYLTFKIDYFADSGKWIYSDEHEVEVDDFDNCQAIIKHLGLKELVRVENEKHIYNIENYEVVLEDVKDLGLFLEVELMEQVADDEVEKQKQLINQFVERLDIGAVEEIDAGKPELMLKKLKNIDD